MPIYIYIYWHIYIYMHTHTRMYRYIFIHMYCIYHISSLDEFSILKIHQTSDIFRKRWRWAKKRGVELGAGLGLPAIVAARLGSEVVATAACQLKFKERIVEAWHWVLSN